MRSEAFCILLRTAFARPNLGDDMNYAEDRLDRRARHGDNNNETSSSLLWKDYTDALRDSNHSLLAKTLRDVGWNRQALFHFALAWRLAPASWQASADYCQMADLAGFAEVALVAALVYRTVGALKPVDDASATRGIIIDGCSGRRVLATDWQSLLSSEPPPIKDCGCGHPDCDASLFAVPFEATALDQVMELLQQYMMRQKARFEEESSTDEKVDTANTIRRKLAIGEDPAISSLSEIPDPLQFWTDSTSDGKVLRPLPVVFQLLLIKLLYLILPSLAAEAVVHARFEAVAVEMATDYKSHWAYYVLIRAVVLGERIKPSRRHTVPYYHVPVWDLLWQLDWRRDVKKQDSENTTGRKHSCRPVESIETFLERFRRSVFPESGDLSMSPLLWRLPARKSTCSTATPLPLYLVGDSHVISLAWQRLYLAGQWRLVVPVVVTGLKAWHVQKGTRFFTQASWQRVLRRLQPYKDGPTRNLTIVVSAGEIDCREGVGGPALQGYTENCRDHVDRTVQEYIRALQQLLVCTESPSPCIEQILVMPVPPHCKSRKGRARGRAARRETTRLWNRALREQLSSIDDSIYFLDYETALLHVDDFSTDEDQYVLRPEFNADSTHMNAAFARHFEQAVMECGCNLDIL